MISKLFLERRAVGKHDSQKLLGYNILVYHNLLVHTIATREGCIGIVSTTLPVYRSAIYPQGMIFKYGIRGKAMFLIQLTTKTAPIPSDSFRNEVHLQPILKEWLSRVDSVSGTFEHITKLFYIWKIFEGALISATETSNLNQMFHTV